MARILLRAHKDPFTVVSPKRAYRSNTIGDNVGNLLFSNASYKLLQTRGTEVVTGRLQGGREEAERLNDEVDHVVIPLANAFRLSFQGSLERMTDAIEALKVPVTVLGVGAQMHLNGRTDRLDAMRPAVTRFMRAVLDRSPSVGVRGEFTERYLRGLGFDAVDVIGCPSLFMQGPGLRIDKRVAALGRSSRISMNLSPYVSDLGPMVQRHTERYPKLRYTAQHVDALGLLLDPAHTSKTFATDQSVLPTHHRHPLVAQGRTSFFVDPTPWIAYLRRFDFSFGTRIHGNIAALLAGTPAYVLAHDSRTLELARYYDIPHRTTNRVTATTDAAALYAEADYTAFNEGHRERFTRFTDFVEAHGLAHVYQPGEDPLAFDRRTALTPYPGDVATLGGPARASAASLLRGLPRRLARRPAAAVA